MLYGRTTRYPSQTSSLLVCERHTRDVIDVENECALEKADGEPFETVPAALLFDKQARVERETRD